MSEPAATTEPTYPVVDFAPLDPRVHDDYWNALTDVREKCPVGWTTSQWSMTESGQWLVNTHRDVMTAATDWQTYSSADGVSSVQLPLDILRLIPVETDPPIHREVRKALNPFFTPYALGEKVGEIAGVVDELMAECLAQGGPVDFVASFTHKLPPVVFLGSAFLDSTEEQGRQLLELVDILLTKPELTMDGAQAPGLVRGAVGKPPSSRPARGPRGRRRAHGLRRGRAGAGREAAHRDHQPRGDGRDGDHDGRTRRHRVAAGYPPRAAGPAAGRGRANGRPGDRGVPALRHPGLAAVAHPDQG
ncbi:MAG: hypothetical protein H0V07_04315, partial [Propionibacteriales bacterium]|nr:hypothetical protein [Propionibacteriales bacterium]